MGRNLGIRVQSWLLEPAMMLRSRTPILKGLLCAGVLAAGCSPAVDAGECAEGTPCPRGEMCNLEEAVCEPLDLPTNATESPAPASFSQKAFPFFRGQVCTVTESQAGAAFPVFVNPCVHPCIDVSRFEFKHAWNCTGSTCDAYAALWLTGDGAACPEDAFGAFPANQCVYPAGTGLTIDPNYGDGSPVKGTMEFEIPFLSNADAQAIAAAGGDQTVIEERIAQYAQDPSRVVGGAPISLLDNHPAPPADCGPDGSGCDCFEIGF
jgi:hypothetical protein